MNGFTSKLRDSLIVVFAALVPLATGYVVALASGSTRMLFGLLWMAGAFVTANVTMIGLVFWKWRPLKNLIILGLVGGHVLAFAWMTQAGPTEREIRRMVQRDFPVGMTYARVAALLDNKGIFHEDQPDSIYANMPDRIIADWDSGFIMYFYFTKKSKLKYVTVTHWAHDEDDDSHAVTGESPSQNAAPAPGPPGPRNNTPLPQPGRAPKLKNPSPSKRQPVAV